MHLSGHGGLWQRHPHQRGAHLGDHDGSSDDGRGNRALPPLWPGSPAVTDVAGTSLSWRTIWTILLCILGLSTFVMSCHIAWLMITGGHPHVDTRVEEMLRVDGVEDVGLTGDDAEFADAEEQLQEATEAAVHMSRAWRQRGGTAGAVPATLPPVTTPLEARAPVGDALPLPPNLRLTVAPASPEAATTATPRGAAANAATEPPASSSTVRFSAVVAVRGGHLPPALIDGLCRARSSFASARVEEIIVAIDKSHPVPAGELATVTRNYAHSLCALKIITVGVLPTRSSLAMLLNHGAAKASPVSTHLLLLTAPIVPRDIVAFMRHMTAGVVEAAIAGCTTLTGDGPNATIEQHGLEPAIGSHFMSSLVPVVMAQRRLAGVSWADDRISPTAGAAAVPFVSPRCMAVRKSLFYRLKGFASAPAFTIDAVLRGELTDSSFTALAKRALARYRAAEKQIVSLSVARVARETPDFKTTVRRLAELLRETRPTLLGILKSVGLSESMAPEPAFVRAEEEYAAFVVEVRKLSLQEQLHDTYDRLYATLAEVEAADLASEMELGVEFCLRAHAALAAPRQLASFEMLVNRRSVLVTPAIAHESQSQALVIPAVAAWAAGRHFGRFNVTFTLSTRFQDLHGAQLIELVRQKGRSLVSLSDGTVKESLLRVVWDMFCCECCGFASEVAQLAFPLRRYLPVDLTVGPQCFCPGYPAHLTDSMSIAEVRQRSANSVRHGNEFVVMLLHRAPGAYFMANFPRSLQKPDFVIGRSMFEFSRLPNDWGENAITNNYTDLIWVPSEVTRQVFIDSGVPPAKLDIVPEAIDVHYFNPEMHEPLEYPFTRHPRIGRNIFCNFIDKASQRQRRFAPTTRRPFIFFSDFKWEPRKGWDVLFDAYSKAFTRDDDTVLYVLTTLYIVAGVNATSRFNSTYIMNEILSHHREVRRDPSATLEQLPRFCLVVDDLVEDDMVRLYRSADAFVLPTRGEGWCLTAFQAMAMGLPAIVTGYGGQSAFMRDDNSFLIDYRLEKPPPNMTMYGRDPAGEMQWAVPDVASVVRHMRYVVSHPAEARARGVAARRHIVENFSEERVALVIRDKLMAIHEQEVRRRAESAADDINFPAA